MCTYSQHAGQEFSQDSSVFKDEIRKDGEDLEMESWGWERGEGGRGRGADPKRVLTLLR